MITGLPVDKTYFLSMVNENFQMMQFYRPEYLNLSKKSTHLLSKGELKHNIFNFFA